MIDGMRAGDEFKRLRLRQAGPGRLGLESVGPGDGGGVPAFVGQVVSDAAAIAPGKFFLVQPATILGPEAEGGVAMLSSNPKADVPVYLLGPGRPAKGDALVCRFVDHRWVAEVSGAGPVGPTPIAVQGCFCQVPTTLRMTSADPTCNYGMFQSCSIQYGPPDPAYAPLGIVKPAFLSTMQFIDPLADASFSYLLTCRFNRFSLTRLYPKSPYGSPYRDGILYTWLVGGAGNTCTPFRLDNGTPYPGGDATCSVTIESA